MEPTAAAYTLNSIIFLIAIVASILNFIGLRQLRRHNVQGLEMALWITVIIMLPIIGALIYFVVGNPRHARDNA